MPMRDDRLRVECFNDWGGGDTTIPSPEMAPKQPLPGTGLHDPLHGRHVCPEFNSFHQGVGQINPPEGLFSCRPLPKRGQVCYIPSPPPIVERLCHSSLQGLNAEVVTGCFPFSTLRSVRRLELSPGSITGGLSVLARGYVHGVTLFQTFAGLLDIFTLFRPLIV